MAAFHHDIFDSGFSLRRKIVRHVVFKLETPDRHGWRGRLLRGAYGYRLAIARRPVVVRHNDAAAKSGLMGTQRDSSATQPNPGHRCLSKAGMIRDRVSAVAYTGHASPPSMVSRWVKSPFRFKS